MARLRVLVNKEQLKAEKDIVYVIQLMIALLLNALAQVSMLKLMGFANVSQQRILWAFIGIEQLISATPAQLDASAMKWGVLIVSLTH
jgi:hypothetical protein